MFGAAGGLEAEELPTRPVRVVDERDARQG